MRATAILGLLLLCVPAVRADSSDEAKAYFQHGTALYALHRFGEAAIQFEKAFELKPDPAILYNAAQAHRFGGNKQRALELYESYLRIYGDRPNAGEVRDHVTELRSAIEADRRATNAPPKEPAPMSPTRPGEPTPSVTPPSAPPPTGVVPAPAPAVAETSTAPAVVVTDQPKPLVKKPWFWAVIGGAAVVVATGVVLGVTLGSPAKDPSPTYGVANGN